MREVFTNTFQNGLSSDYNVVYQPDGTYRYMKNCSLVSQDGNNFIIKDSLGNLLTFTINSPYSSNLAMTIGFISFPDKLIIFSTNSNSEAGGYGEIGKIEYLPYGEGIQPRDSGLNQAHVGYVPLYHHADLNFSQQHRIEGFSFVENKLIERVYWTDHYNEPRVFNVSDSIFTTYIASGSLSSVAGTQYMVLEGAIEYPVASGDVYGPGRPNGNIVTVNGVDVTYTATTGTSPTPKVIAYFPYQLLDFTPSRTMGNITFNQFGNGSLYCGSKIYFYRLVSSSGISTTWSYGSSPIPVGTLNDADSLTSPTVSYHDWVGGGTSTALLSSDLSVLLNITNIDTNFDFIEVACAEYDQSDFAPRQITIIANEAITGESMIITHSGDVNLGELTLADITLFPASILKCKTLATNKSYILAGNITQREEFVWSQESDPLELIQVEQFQYPMNVHREASSCSLGGMVYSGVSPLSGGYSATTAAGTITPFSRWLVTSGTVTYNGTNYTTGEVFVGVTGAGNDIATISTSGTFVPCVVRNKYTSFLTGDTFPEAIEIVRTDDTVNDCFWDYKSAAAHHHVASYWSGETYRYGILFYDLKGNPFYVKHLADYTFDTLLDKTGNIMRIDQIGNLGTYVYSLNPSGVKFSNIKLTAAEAAQISGFSIVRAERDATIVSQGLVTQNVATGASPNVYRPASWNPISFDQYGASPADKIYTFLCPDELVDAPLKKSIGQVGDTMEEATWLEAYDYGGGRIIRGGGSTVVTSDQVYMKLMTPADDRSVRTGTITFYESSITEGDTITGFPSGATYENGTMHTAVGAGTSVDGACVSGAANYALDNHYATGCKKSVFILGADFKHYGPSANDYTSAAANGQTEKILMNYKKSGVSTPYGGTGANALANTLYISTGHFQPINASVLADVSDGSGGYIFNDVEVFGGDCFPSLIDIGYGLWDDAFGVNLKYSFAWTFPCECNSNYNLRRGRKTSNVEMYYTGTPLTNSIAALLPSTAIQLEDFSYNPGYSSEGSAVVYPALPVNFSDSTSYLARIRWAGQKVLGELIDSFRMFALNDLKDISSNYGKINKIGVKDDKVVVWQDLATNTVPILERQVITGNTGDATTIGTGGVVDRWDVISSFFGTQHQWSVTETQYGFAFFDMNKKAFVILDFGAGEQEVSQIFGLKAFFDEVFLEIEGNNVVDEDLLINSPTFAETSDHPLVGLGISSFYDPKFKMTYMTFKFYGQNAAGLKSKDFTVGYLHSDTKKCFVGFYDMTPCIAHAHNGHVFMVNNPKNTTQYLDATGVLTNESFVVGETLWGTFSNKQKEYVCIANVTLDNAAKYPEGASGATYWLEVNSVDQLWVLNQPNALGESPAPDYVYNKYFGLVADNEVHIIINPQVRDDEIIEVQSISQNGSYGVNYTDVYVDADNQSGADNDITSSNTNYRFIKNKIVSTIPLSTAAGYTGRINNRYLRVRFVKHNWTTDPTVLTTSIKYLRSLVSLFIKKK